VTIATQTAPTLGEKKISLHVLRHTAAMRLLHGSVRGTVWA
jgi:integrase